MKFCILKSFLIHFEPVRQVLPFHCFKTDHLVSGESTLHQVTGYEFTSYTFFRSIENFSAYCNSVLRGSILLPPLHLSVFARMARWQLELGCPLFRERAIHRRYSIIEKKKKKKTCSCNCIKLSYQTTKGKIDSTPKHRRFGSKFCDRLTTTWSRDRKRRKYINIVRI